MHHFLTFFASFVSLLLDDDDDDDRMYKHVAKQRKLIDENKEVTLSDEDSSGNEDSDEGSSADESNSDAGEGDSDDDDSEDSEDDEEEVAGEEEKAKELELAPPPTGFPTAEEAILAPVANTEKEGTNDVVPVCVICPTKALKPGRMLEVHLGSKVSFNWVVST